MGRRVVLPTWVCKILHLLINNEVSGLEGNVHGKHGAIGPIEGPQPLSHVDSLSAGEG